MKQSILKRYPSLNENDFTLRDDGEGIFIDVWNCDDPKPTMEEVEQWALEDENEPKPKTEIDLLREENAQLNLSIIDLYEMVMG
jgi:hypothetical protein